MLPSGLAALCLLLLQTGALGFGILPGDSLNHLEITEKAILNATVQVCRKLAQAEGARFNLQDLTAEAVAAACSSSGSSKSFRQVIKFIKQRNRRVDIRYALNPGFHFDNEKFTEGRKIITDGISAVKASNRRGNYEAARQKLGEILHPLQDFYSHSNWMELGNKLPNSNLIRSDSSIGNIAGESRATCRSCDGNDCRNNILQDILQENLLTSGYFGIVPFISTKPKGKCSHGGFIDQTSWKEPKGGINKDSKSSSHGHLHTEAANTAIAATRELLEDIQGAAGDRDFLQLMGISKGSNKALCFVIDTTRSMRGDIDVVKSLTSFLIDSKIGTADEPSLYILVPFRDPDFGPLMRTTDAKVFKDQINTLEPAGGGNFPEPSLSALQLALTGAPHSSEIFLFTDAPAKDKQLKSTVIALMERTNTVVNFMLTDVLGLHRRRQRDSQHRSRITASDAQLYRDLAQASGGQAIEVTKSELSVATSIIRESSSSSLVTLLQAARTPGRPDNFTFSVDESVRNLIIYIIGRSLSFTLISPSGASQSSLDKTGVLGTIQSVGNFQTVRLDKQVGLWEIRVVSTEPYTLKVTGQNAIDFLFDFVELSHNPNQLFDVLETRPRAGVNGTLLVSVTGSDSASVTEVALVESSGSGEVNGRVESLGGGDFLVRVDRIPSVDFVVLVKGQDNNNSVIGASPAGFQRQSSTNFRASNLTITADSNNVIEPGSSISVPFSVMTSGTGGNFTIRATSDQGFDSTSPTSLFLETGGSANGTVTLTVPLNTPSGSDVTLTIEAEAPGATDTNYAVLRFSIVTEVTDIIRPVCQVISVTANCSDDCSQSTWELTANLTDGNGTGIERISMRQGNGTLDTSTTVGADGENVILASYSASCCSADVELVAVDAVGNVGSCFRTIRATADANSATTSSQTERNTSAADSTVSTASSGNHLVLPSYFYLTIWALVMLGPFGSCFAPLEAI
ncbi:von Willebrand factor A domain-containing protein 7-like [Centroberyx affinis]|uniref:von Willebrand factor A domain-containing protein 7-like n=1 Tax=Centroberyx affinis TaxID=166261 RepID=UPI003A5C0DB0